MREHKTTCTQYAWVLGQPSRHCRAVARPRMGHTASCAAASGPGIALQDCSRPFSESVSSLLRVGLFPSPSRPLPFLPHTFRCLTRFGRARRPRRLIRSAAACQSRPAPAAAPRPGGAGARRSRIAKDGLPAFRCRCSEFAARISRCCPLFSLQSRHAPELGMGPRPMAHQSRHACVGVWPASRRRRA